MRPGLVSIIMPAFNAEATISMAIESVIAQTYSNWELIIVNDGSTDDTSGVIRLYKDYRIKVIEQSNKGVSAARNVGLSHINGSFICFFDADDLLPPHSIDARMSVLQDDSIDFADGAWECMSSSFDRVLLTRRPSYRGMLQQALLRLDERAFIGQSILVRRDPAIQYAFKEGMSHAEDLLFYIQISKDKRVAYTDRVVLQYRTGGQSAMSNIHGLEQGYLQLWEEIKELENMDQCLWQRKVVRIMFLSYLKRGYVLQSILAPWRMIFAMNRKN